MELLHQALKLRAKDLKGMSCEWEVEMENRWPSKILIATAALIGLLSVGGCSSMRVSSFDTLLKRDPGQVCRNIQLYKRDAGAAGVTDPMSWDTVGSGDDWDMELHGFLKYQKELKHNAGEALDDFLDCTVANIGADAPEELKAYRGYVVLAVLSRYAAFNYTGQIAGEANMNFSVYSGMHDDALATLARIEAAERVLRASSGLKEIAATVSNTNPNPSIEATYLMDGEGGKLPTVSKLHRTLAVLLVATGAEKPTLKRAKSWLARIAEAASGVLLNRDDVLDQGLKVVGKSLTLKTFGNAYLDDVRCDLESHMGEDYIKGEDGKSEQLRCQTCKDQKCHSSFSANGSHTPMSKRPAPEEWQYWARIIENSCDRIATSVGTGHHCLSDWDIPEKKAPAGGNP